MNKIILFPIIIILSFKANALECVRFDQVSPVVEVKIDFDATTKLYQYTYSLENKAEATQNIKFFLLRGIEQSGLKDVVSPQIWHGRTFRNDGFWWRTSEAVDPLPDWFDINKYDFAPLAYSIKPGQKFEGFSFKSPNPPASVSFYVLGEGQPQSMENGQENLVEECKSSMGGIYDISVMGKTLAPVKQASTVSVEINIKPMSVEPVPFNPKAKGVLPVAILGTSDLKGSDINASSVVFGPKEIKALKHTLEDVNKDGHEDLVMHFQSDQTGIRCGPDLAVALKGSLKDGRLIQGVQSITPVGCKSKVEKDKKTKPKKDKKSN